MHSRHTAHDRYRDPLIRLADPAALLPLVEAWAGAGWSADGAPRASGATWRRVYGRFRPFEAPYATLVFEYGEYGEYGEYREHGARPDDRAPASGVQTFVTVHLFDDRPAVSAGEAQGVAGLGWARLTAFPDDAGLPTLTRVLRTAGAATVVRYRPGRRCTFRVADDHGVRFGKVFGDDSGRAIHDAGIALAAAAGRGEVAFAVAAPIAWDADLRVLWQGAVPGRPLLDRLSSRDAEPLAQEMGAALGTLTTATVYPATRFDAAVQCTRSHQYAQELGTRIPALAVEAASLGEGLDAIHRQRPGRVCPIHGAPHVNQWLADGDRLALVDFDRFSAGNPELDVATFLGELDFEEELATPVARIARAFVRGYETTAGPLDPLLLSAYRAHKRLAKALRSARALRPDGAERATRHLALATAALRDGGDT